MGEGGGMLTAERLASMAVKGWLGDRGVYEDLKKTVFGANASVGIVEVAIDGDDYRVKAHLAKGFRPRTIEVNPDGEGVTAG